MSDIAFAVERVREAFAMISQLEAALARDPFDKGLQMNLAATRKMALRSEEELLSFSGRQKIEVCKYRLVPETAEGFAVSAVSQSMGGYQSLFSQIYDAKKNGGKANAVIGREALSESELEFGYSYSGSLGMVLLTKGTGSQDMFGGTFNASIDALFEVLSIEKQSDVRRIAAELGLAVVKRLHAWSNANRKAGFAADVRWTRADGRQQGQVVDSDAMTAMVELIDATSDEVIEKKNVVGQLVGVDLKARTFHVIGPGGISYRGALAADFPAEESIVVGRPYNCVLVETSVTKYAADKVDRSFELEKLWSYVPNENSE